MEFRYDGARQRYLVRRLDPDTLAALGYGDDQWTTYLGDEPVDDYHYDSSQYTWPVDRQYLFGVAEWHADADTTGYLHGDLIGSTVAVTSDDATPAVVRRVVYTAFGEAISVAGPDGNPTAAPFATRYGYAGAFGYQEHDVGSCGLIGTNSLPPAEGCTATAWSPDGLPDSLLNASPLAGFRFQHLGHRYYDPSTGRFIQRDPIGLRGGLNVYAYVRAQPTGAVDPRGLISPLQPNGGGADYWTPPPPEPTHPSTGLPWPEWKGPGDIREETYAHGCSRNKGDSWMHFVVSCRVASETEGGWLYLLPGGIVKEIADNIRGTAGGYVDSIEDIAANGAGWCHGLGAAVFGDSCEDLADGLCP